MNKFRVTVNILAAAVVMLTIASMAQAQATRTWVSGVGDDVNPCSRTAPCKTFAGAISKTANNGEINAIDSGGFGAVTITKSITIDGEGVMASILASGTTGIIINSATANVVIKNLSINGASTGLHGIRIIAAASVSVEGVSIFGFTSHGINMNLGPGAVSKLFVKDCFIRTGNTTVSRGISIEPTTGTADVKAVIDNVRMERMFIGFFGGAGAISTVRNSAISGMANAGIITQAASNAQTNIENCVLNHNVFGVQAGTGASTITRISNSMVINNSGKGFSVAGGTLISFGNNSVQGNGADDPPTTTTPQI